MSRHLFGNCQNKCYQLGKLMSAAFSGFRHIGLDQNKGNPLIKAGGSRPGNFLAYLNVEWRLEIKRISKGQACDNRPVQTGTVHDGFSTG